MTNLDDWPELAKADRVRKQQIAEQKQRVAEAKAQAEASEKKRQENWQRQVVDVWGPVVSSLLRKLGKAYWGDKENYPVHVESYRFGCRWKIGFDFNLYGENFEVCLAVLEDPDHGFIPQKFTVYFKDGDRSCHLSEVDLRRALVTAYERGPCIRNEPDRD